jgi:hypothetical protein
LAVLSVFAVNWLIYLLFYGGPSVWGTFKRPETEPLLKQFMTLKEQQARTDPHGMPPEVGRLYISAKSGNWLSFSNSFNELAGRWRGLSTGPGPDKTVSEKAKDFVIGLAYKVGWQLPVHEPPPVEGISGEPIREIYGVMRAFKMGDEKYVTEFGREIIGSIPPHSIYFAGSEPGRCIVTAMCRSQTEGDTFFTFAADRLGYQSYLEYLQSMYGNKIHVLTSEDVGACYQEYVLAMKSASTNAAGGGVTAMDFNSVVARAIFDQCPTNGFYVEQRFAIDWMYPHLEPHGLIFKLDRQPLAGLSDEVIQQDRDYWRKSLTPKIGGWLGEDTKIKTIAIFARKIFSQQDFKGFSGDPQFVQNDYTCRLFSRERSNIAGLYDWRARHATSDDEKQRMSRQADFAFRQAWALCPYCVESMFPYINFLLSQSRFDDALIVAETAAALPQNKDNEQILQLPAQLKQFMMDHPSAPAD